jgi:hypothetical protein
MTLAQASAQDQIGAEAAVTRQQIQLAKQVMSASTRVRVSSSVLIASVLTANGLSADEARPVVVLNDRYDPTTDIRKAGKTFGWTRAAIQAIWELIYAGWFIPAGDIQVKSFEVTFTTVYGNSGGTTGSHAFIGMEIPVPVTLYLGPGRESGAAGTLRDPDLFLASLSVSNMSDEVRQALSEAIRCFKADLFTAAVAMLGKASESAWLELGDALLDHAGPSHRVKFKKHEAALDNPRVGPLAKMEAVQEIYNDVLFDPLIGATGIRRDYLKPVRVWSDVIRDSRNTLHPGAVASTPNNYEKVADLLLSAAQHLPTLYKLKHAAKP